MYLKDQEKKSFGKKVKSIYTGAYERLMIPVEQVYYDCAKAQSHSLSVIILQQQEHHMW